LQTGARGAAESLSRFVEGPDGGQPGALSHHFEPERKDFWDDLASLGTAQDNRVKRTTGAIGTAAMKGPSSASGSVAHGASTATAKTNSLSTTTRTNDESGWDDNW
jgi:ADP-ribosylation factor GTPase-activating protein 1